jgi:tripartite-type tricarboxylate transporter receptor subunit TctC
MKFHKKLGLVALGLLSTMAFAVPVLAGPKKPANYPNRPITIIICFGKAGGSAQSVQAIQGIASKIMGVKVNMVAKPGGGGLNCLPDFEQTPADGYTILQHIDALPAKYAAGATDLNPAKDLVPLLIMNVAPSGLFIRGGDKRFLTNGKPDFEKVLAYARSGKGKLTVSNINVPMELVTMSVLEKYFGFKAKQVLFSKPAQRYGAVIGGKLDVLFEQPSDVSKYVQAGKLAPVLSVWPTRFKMSPDTPATGQDYGLKWSPLLRFRGLFVKKGTPPKIVKYLQAVFKEAYYSDKYQAFIKRKKLDIVESYRNPADTKKEVENAITTYAKVFKELGQKVRPGL